MVKYQKVSKLYDHDCLQNFILLFMSLMLKTAFIVKNSHIFAGIYFIFLKNVLYQTLKSFSGKFGSHWKARKSSYQVRNVLAPFCTLVALVSV